METMTMGIRLIVRCSIFLADLFGKYTNLIASQEVCLRTLSASFTSFFFLCWFLFL